MRNQVLVKRYAQGLVGAVRDEQEYAAIRGELADFRKLSGTSRELADMLASPFIPARKKTLIIKNILTASGVQAKTARFLILLLEHNRFGLLAEILEALPVLWNERRGVATFEVSSVVPLSEAQREKLQRELRRLEGRPVFLLYKIDPALVGGLSLKKGNAVYDASVSGHLARLREKISEG